MYFNSLFRTEYLSDNQKKLTARVLKKAKKYTCKTKTNQVVLASFLNNSTNNNLLKLLGKENYNKFFNSYKIDIELIICLLETKTNQTMTIKELIKLNFFDFFKISINRFKRICVSSDKIETAFTAGLDWIRLH